MQIIRRANELGEDSLSLSKRYCEEYLNDMGDLQCRLPTKQPCVSGHMKQITDMITQVCSCTYALFVSHNSFNSGLAIYNLKYIWYC